MENLSFQALKQAAADVVTDGLKLIRLALLGDSATQFYNQALGYHGLLSGYNLDVFEADYGQVDFQILTTDSELYQANPDVVVVELTTKKLIKQFYKSDIKSRESFSELELQRYRGLVETLQGNTNAKVIFHNYEELDDAVFGNYANKHQGSFLYQLRKINLGLAELSQEFSNLFIADTCSLHNRLGSEFSQSSKFYITADVAHSIDFIAHKAKATIDIVKAIKGNINKCLIVDLDNTLWGGIIGDDGVENIQLGDLGIGKVFTELQLWIKELKNRGIIIAVCSKNDEAIAKEPFNNHPDMVLSLDDVAVFVANWDNKADNIRHIQEVLNIGFDSMVFIDDNPAERAIVKENIQRITVPDLPDDPADYLSYLQSLNLFETASHSAADESRTKQYQEEAKRKTYSQTYTDVNAFLRSLEMKAEVRHFQPFDVPRVAQLTQRSNQFNLRTVRYTEEDIKRITEGDNHVTFAFNLKDKFGDYGLISIIIAEKKGSDLFIDTWIMSCRVLKRSMEQFVLNTIVGYAKNNGIGKLVGEYLPTAKNKLVENHYRDLGFEQKENLWYLDVSKAELEEYFIEKQ